jgi:hypothetical protein
VILPVAEVRDEKLANLAGGVFSGVDYARYNENFVLVVTSSCCIRSSVGIQRDIKGEALG